MIVIKILKITVKGTKLSCEQLFKQIESFVDVEVEEIGRKIDETIEANG